MKAYCIKSFDEIMAEIEMSIRQSFVWCEVTLWSICPQRRPSRCRGVGVTPQIHSHRGKTQNKCAGGDQMKAHTHTASSHRDKINRTHRVGALLQSHPGLCGALVVLGRTPAVHQCPKEEAVGGPKSPNIRRVSDNCHKTCTSA